MLLYFGKIENENTVQKYQARYCLCNGIGHADFNPPSFSQREKPGFPQITEKKISAPI